MTLPLMRKLVHHTGRDATNIGPKVTRSNELLPKVVALAASAQHLL
jgi:hypothetical protein